MSASFEDAMKKRTDAELLRIVGEDRADYNPDALVAAELELKNRNLSGSQLQVAHQEVVRVTEEAKQKAEEPLEVEWKLACLLLPGLATLLLAGKMRDKAYRRRQREAWRWTFYGIGLYVLWALLKRL